MDESPPVIVEFFSRMTTLAPARAASTAQLMPAMPLPTTTMSASLDSWFLAGFARASCTVSVINSLSVPPVEAMASASAEVAAAGVASEPWGAHPAKPPLATTAAVVPRPNRNERRDTAPGILAQSFSFSVVIASSLFRIVPDSPVRTNRIMGEVATGRQHQKGW